MPDTAHWPILLPLRSRSRDKPRSHALRAEASVMTATTRHIGCFWADRMLLILAPGPQERACPASCRAPAVKPENGACLTQRIGRFYCRFAADRGTSHAPTPFG